MAKTKTVAKTDKVEVIVIGAYFDTKEGRFVLPSEVLELDEERAKFLVENKVAEYK